MQFFNQLTRSVGEIWRWKISSFTRPYRQLRDGFSTNIAIHLNEYTVSEKNKQINKTF